MRYELSYYMPEDDHGDVILSGTDPRYVVAEMGRMFGENEGMTLWVWAAIARSITMSNFDPQQGTVWTFRIIQDV